MELGLRILKFFDFIYRQKWEGSIAYHDGEFHVIVTHDGPIYSYGQAPTLTGALNECLSGFEKVGF